MQFQVDKDYIIRIYQQLHQVPEIGFDLPQTLAIVRQELDFIGISYTEELGKSCIVATLNEGVGNKTIAIRADMDALPIQEETGLSYASTIPGQMHACGHDAHTAMLLGTAKALKAMEMDIKCCVKFVFQSAEEILGGAKTLCEDGFMEQVDEIISCHINAERMTNQFAINRTCNSACSRGFKLHLYGKSSHAAKPHGGVDAIAMAVRVYTDIQFMRAREINPTEKVVIGVGAIHGGKVNNIVCDHVEMNCTLRTQSTQLDEHIYKRITQIAQSVAADMGGRAELETYKYVPALINDLNIADYLEEAATKVLGKENIFARKEALGGEDFAYYLQHKPGAMFNIGIRDEGMSYVPAHNGKLVVSENALEAAPKIFIQYVLDQMEK